MTTTFDRLAGFADAISETKRSDVAAASEQKKIQAGGLEYQAIAGQQAGVGFDSASEQERDIRTLNAEDYGRKYGMEALLRRGDATGQVIGDMTQPRTFSQGAADTVTDIGTGLVNAFGGIGAFGAGLVSDRAGVAIAKELGDFNEWSQSTQSPALQARRNVQAAQLASASRDNQALTESNPDTFMGGIERIGRDVLSSVRIGASDPVTLGSGISQGVGSLLAAGPLIAGVRNAVPRGTRAGIAAAAAIDAATGTTSAARALNAAGSLAPAATAIGAMEGGGAFQSTVNRVLEQSHDDLMRTSEDYRAYIQEGMSQEDAKTRLAAETGRIAGGLQAGLGAVVSPLVGRFEANPLGRQTLGSAGANMLAQTIEEGVQGAGSQLAENTAVRMRVDADQDLLDGVGEQAGLGALYGLGTSAVIQAPGVAANAARPVAKATMATARNVGKVANAATAPAREALRKRGEAIQAQNEKASPLSDENIAQANNEAVASAAQAEQTLRAGIEESEADTAAKEAANQYVTDLMQATQFNISELDSPLVSDTVRQAVGNATTRSEAFARLSDLVNQTEVGTTDYLSAALTLHEMTNNISGFIERSPAALDQLPNGHEANIVLDQFSGLLGNLTNTPKVIRALQTINSMLAEAEVAPVTEASLNTPEGQQNVQVAVAQAVTAPENSNPDAVNQILKHSREGKIALTNPQRAALETAAALLQGARRYDNEANKLGLRPQDIVSLQIKTDESRTEEGQYSALQHAKGVRSAYNAGNLELAAARLDDFLKFAQHMQNKVGAINAHLATGNGDPNRSVHYQSLTSDRKWVTSRKGLGVNPTNTNSIKFAQQVGLEASTVGEIANNLASAYPELSVGHIELIPLDSRLNKPAAQVVQDFKQTDSGVVTSTKKPEPAKVEEKTPTTKKAADVTVAPKTEDSKVMVKASVTESVKEKSEESVDTPNVSERTGIDAVYPDLVGSIDPNAEGIKNYFKQSFKLPKEAKTRTIGDESPLSTIKEVLSSATRFSSFLGLESKKILTPEIVSAYSNAMASGEMMAKSLRDNLKVFLSEKSVGKRFAEGTEANRWVEGKLLNIVKPEGDSFIYDENLLQLAVLAGLQWRITALDRGSIKDEKDAVSVFGLEEGEQSAELVAILNSGLTTTEAVNSLAQKVESYWGLTRNNNAPLGYVKGIPAAMGAELLRIMVDNEQIGVTRVNVSREGVILPSEEGAYRTVDIYHPLKLDKEDPIMAYPTAIEEAVLVEPEERMYLGDDRPSVSATQLRNPGVENTPESRAALKKEIDTPFYLHKPMVDFFEAMGRDRIIDLMGAGQIKPELLNQNHAISLEGKNRTIAGAYDYLIGLVQQINNQSDDITSVPVHFNYNMTRVGRMQMLGKYNPQSTKLVREALLPTQSTLDLSSENGQDFGRFALGLAQALGIKVHNMPRQDSVTKVLAKLNNDLSPSVDMLRSWLDDGGELPLEAVSTLRSNLGGDLSFVALHALVEYARYLNADSESRAEFSTPMYVEADGVTNGPVNAMMLMSAGPFDTNFLRNVAKGGLFFKPGMTMNEYRSSVDGKDLYETTTDLLSRNIQNLRQEVSRDAGLLNQLNQVQRLMDLFLPDLSIDENGRLELKRGIAKNPLTITIYGSGAAGIANKMVSAVVESIYERMSQAVQAVEAGTASTPALALFGSQSESVEDANTKFGQFVESLNALTSNVVSRRKKELVLERVEDTVKRKDLDFNSFTFQPSEIKTMQQNMLHLFVNPMREAITDTVGGSLMNSTRQLMVATQVQSLWLQEAFREAVQAKLEEKTKDPKWKKGDFLSQAELDSIEKGLGKFAPLIQTGSQNFYIAGSQNSEVVDMDVARALNGRIRIPVQVYGPADAGVAGIPTMTIGTGDGYMMQALSITKGAPKGTLKIFDGMNMKLSTIEEDAVKANQAVYESWMGNPLQAVSESFQKFLKNADFSNMSKELTTSLTRSLLEPKYWNKPVKPEQLQAAAESLNDHLIQLAQEAEARHRALNRVNLSIDQMAAVGSPFQTTGKIDLSSLGIQEQLAKLNELYQEELNNLRKPAKSAIPAERPNQGMDAVGRVHKASGARVLSPTAIRNLARITNLPTEQAQVLREIQKSLAAKDYKVIFGSAEQVNLYAQLTGKDTLDPSDLAEVKRGNIDGWTNPSDRHIYLVKPSNETLIHELVHASTYETVYAHYDGTLKGEQAEVIKQAVGRLEVLMDQFLRMDVSEQSPEYREAHADAVYVINQYLQDGFVDPVMSKTGALNEYMAWGLTNRELAARQTRTAANPLARMVKAVISAVKSIIWGRKIAPKVGDDMFSNLLFNSAIIMRSQPSVMTASKDTTMFMNRAYGNNERLTTLKGTFDKLIVDYMTGPATQTFTRKGKFNSAITQGIALSRLVQANGFPMTMQESSLFRNIVATLAVESEINPQAMARAQELYRHVTKTIKVEDFMSDRNSNDPSDRYYAQMKYNVVMGNLPTTKDESGRSGLLPTFVALAMVNDEMRSVLAKLAVPKADQELNNSLDNILTNAGVNAMESLNRRLAGDTKASTITEAIDALSQTIAETTQESQSFYDSVAVPTGSMIDRTNQIIVDGVNRLSDAAIDKADGILTNPTSSAAMKAAAQGLRFVAAVATEKNGQVVSRGLMSQMNQGNKWKPFHDFVNDVVGRTSENADVYDMIKSVRTQVQQDRQQFREHLPTTIASKFTRKLEDSEWAALHTGLGKTDVAVLRDRLTADQIRELFLNKKTLAKHIKDLENEVRSEDSRYFSLLQTKAKQLANFMITGQAGTNLLRNAEAVARLFGERTHRGRTVSDQLISSLDQLITLYSIEEINTTQGTALNNLARNEQDGFDFSLSYMIGQRVDELNKAMTQEARLNYYKGYIPTESQQGVRLEVLSDAEYANKVGMSYERIGDYVGSSGDRFTGKRGYYFLPVSSRTAFSQGIMQNVRNTVNGVDAHTGYTMNRMTAGRIVDPTSVARVKAALEKGERGNENLMPIYNALGEVVAYERSVDPNYLTRLNQDEHFARMVGVWRGRQMEEAKAQMFNDALVDRLYDMYQTDLKAGRSNEYVNVYASKDPVVVDAWSLVNQATKDKGESLFNDGEFWVRRDLLNDALGYRMASVGDAWTGNSRLSNTTQENIKMMLIGAMGNKAYRSVMTAENMIQGAVKTAKTLIVVKSVVIPVVNFLANVIQMIGRGVPIKNIVTGLPKKTAEIHSYVSTRLRQVEAEAELRAADGDPVKERKLKTEIQSITDAHKRLSIWPLIERGEFSSIADAGISRDDLLIAEGKLQEYIERIADRLPAGIRNAGRYALVAKDTALFQGIQKAVEYSDFIAKALIHDDMIQRQGRTKKDADARVTEEFINYDRLPGRFRGYMESMGLMWFYNFKIRSAKVAMSMIRNNPVHSLIAMSVPTPTMFGNVGIPLEDNVFSVLAEGNLGMSIGPGMGLRAPSLNPWYNLTQ